MHREPSGRRAVSARSIGCRATVFPVPPWVRLHTKLSYAERTSGLQRHSAASAR